MIERLNNILFKILEIPMVEITDDTSPENTENWDSFNGLMLVTELEKEFNVNFSIDEVIKIKNVGDIRRALIKHGVEF